MRGHILTSCDRTIVAQRRRFHKLSRAGLNTIGDRVACGAICTRRISNRRSSDRRFVESWSTMSGVLVIRHAPDRSGWVVQIHHVAHVLLRCFSNYADIVPRMTYRWCGSMLTSLPKLIFISVECDRTRRFIAFLAFRCELGKNVSGKYLRWPDRNAIERRSARVCTRI